MSEINSEILERSKHDVVIYKGLQPYKNGDISYQQSLELIVLQLSKEKEHYFNELVKAIQTRKS